ncbi:hypothetical protein GOP47_0015181 [Adiantum capillus-veneris]|uniref:Uncharacterized protein n=1 Tax=Adiantum capillus-veneris TaxID=13818 RepID=A0A9D4ZCU8_ADICA|nr:hypothetical protein GOP47_0015181 [Adiantum capillus-veneris]
MAFALLRHSLPTTTTTATAVPILPRSLILPFALILITPTLCLHYQQLSTGVHGYAGIERCHSEAPPRKRQKAGGGHHKHHHRRRSHSAPVAGAPAGGHELRSSGPAIRSEIVGAGATDAEPTQQQLELAELAQPLQLVEVASAVPVEAANNIM